MLMHHSRSYGKYTAWALGNPLRTNADDRFSLDPLGPIEGGNGIVEGGHVADVCPQPTIPEPLDELNQLASIGHDDEVDSQAARGPRLRRAGDDRSHHLLPWEWSRRNVSQSHSS